MSSKNSQSAKSFQSLKNTARTFADIEKWFVAHPDCFPPSLPTTGAKLRVDIDSKQLEPAVNKGTVIDYIYINFQVTEANAANSLDYFKETTGFVNVSYDNDRKTTRNKVVNVELDAMEWRFIAADALFELVDSNNFELGDDRQCYSNILAAHANTMTIDTFFNLMHADLVPKKIEAFKDWFFSLNTPAAGTSLPLNIGPT